MKEENISIWQAYTLLNVGTFAHIIYDPENDQIATIQSVSNINENNPNHCWQIIEAGGMHFLYNIGAGKYLKRNGNKLELTDTSEPIDVEDGNNGLIIGKQEAQQWALVINERMNVNISVIDEVTGIESPFREKEEDAVYDIQGRRISEPQKGINIIRMSDGKTGKVLIK